MDLIGEIFGYLAGGLTAVCFLPQTIKTVRTKDVTGLSAISYFIYLLGLLCWIVYGIYLNSIPMMVFNEISFICALVIWHTILTQRGKKK